MKSLKYLLTLIVLIPFCASAQTTDPKDTEVWEPEPRIVTPGETNSAPPSDAIVLFDGKNLDAWQHEDGSAAKWTVKDGIFTVKAGTGVIKTKEVFGDCQLHIEWRPPLEIKGESQGRGNSGVFLQERYEVQVLDSYNNRTYSNGQASSIYKQYMPLVNAMRPSSEWQTYDIIYKAPRFNKDGIKVASGTVTVLHNGVLVQNNVEIKGTTEYIGMPRNIAHGDGSLVLQDHGNPVSFRNIWIRKL